MNTIIRKAGLPDAAALADIGKRTFFETFSGTCTAADMQQFLDDYFNIEQVKKELADENDFYFFAELNGTIAGYMRLMEDYSQFPLMAQWKALELKRIYVDSTFHGKGIAQSLMSFAEDFAKGHHYQVIWLGVWEHNSRAKRFYEKCGFEDSGHTHQFPIGSTPQTDNWLWKFLQ